MVKTQTKTEIFNFIVQQKSVRVKDIIEHFGLSAVMVHRHLKDLLKDNKIIRRGSPPKVFYQPRPSSSVQKLAQPSAESEIVNENFLEIMPSGEFLWGMAGFRSWCQKRNKNIDLAIAEYEQIFTRYQASKRNGLIAASSKIKNSFDQYWLDGVWYQDFYSWEVFGKTLLGKIILYGKQNSSIELIQAVAKKVKPSIEFIIKDKNIDAVILIPHSVPRLVNFLGMCWKILNLSVPRLELHKVFTHHPVAQKTLRRLADREENAQTTLLFTESSVPQNILLIDDACGSGATLNIAAQKIKAKFPDVNIYGFAFVGSANGFEVIGET